MVSGTDRNERPIVRASRDLGTTWTAPYLFGDAHEAELGLDYEVGMQAYGAGPDGRLYATYQLLPSEASSSFFYFVTLPFVP
jgi:hypothetical protein